ncbi:MAG: hypothetical protein Q9219_000722 [cf. Caloplaca sp. 3 TL-2023]
MLDAQSDQNVEFQALRRWIDSAQQPGLGGPSHSTPCGFIPISALNGYLRTNDRVENLLTWLFGRDWTKVIDAETVRNHHLRSFSILLLIGHGKMIEYFVKYRSLQDHQLPYQTRPKDFPHSSWDQNFFDRFYDNQWQFCPMSLEYNMDLHLEKEEILPILHKEELGRGGDAIAYKIVVDSEHNKLVPKQSSVPERRPHLFDTFVLKTYRGTDAKRRHQAERDAFVNLRYNNSSTPFIITFHGSYVDDDTYNILIEYADLGNLEDYWRTTPKPSTKAEKIKLYDRLCSITHGLATIHGGSPETSPDHPTDLGWYHDMKPANILVFSGSGTSEYDVYFKIADLSLCRFKPKASHHHQASALDLFGTRAYGAPETWRQQFSPNPIPIQVQQEVAVWSFGCILSEATVWSSFGWEDVIEYQRSRSLKVEQCLECRGEHIFHNGEKVLSTVQDMHERIRKHRQGADTIEVAILQVVDKHMLLNSKQGRCSAHDAFNHFKRIMAKEQLRLPSKTYLGEDMEERPKTPPSVPVGYIRGSVSSSRRPESTPFSMDSSIGGLGPEINEIRSNSMSSMSNVAPLLSKASGPTSTNVSTTGGNVLGASFSSKSINLQNLPEPPKPIRLSTTHTASMTMSEAQGYDYCQTGHEQDSYRETVPLGEVWSPESIRSDKNSPGKDGAVRKTAIDAEETEQKSKSESEPQRPRLSLGEGLKWKKEKKKGYLSALKDEGNMTYVHGRDHIFVIDNTESMKQYRDNVLEVVSILPYLLKTSDEDGLDLYFTQSPSRVHAKNSTRLFEAVEQKNFHGISNMQARLNHIFQGFKDDFGEKTSKTSGGWWKGPDQAKTRKPLSFYILTDGVWQPKSSARSVILELVESMIRHELPKEHVGIQFIRFGDTPQGIDCLRELDHGLGLGAKEMDIVDTTRWDGNIWKMLLGAISPWYDDDPD